MLQSVQGDLKMLILTDDELEIISGGVAVEYDMESDPLYKRFSAYWKGREDEKGNGMESRAEFISSFHKWVNDGIPKDIGAWYKKNSRS